MSMIRSGGCWPAFGIVAVAGTGWLIADEGGFHPRLSAAAIAQATRPTSRANALTASQTDERRLKGKSVKSYSGMHAGVLSALLAVSLLTRCASGATDFPTDV